MQNTAKYLIRADITADGVVERSDVVGAVFGQTEGLLGDDLDLRDLQDSSKVGRIDVEIDSERGQSFGQLTIATSLDRVETAVLAAALETIERIGPCRSTVDVAAIEDIRAAKRREVVERATALFHEAFDDSLPSSQELIEEVRQAVRVEDITDYRGYPAGPRVTDSDAVIVVEGRADVLRLLQYGIKNAVAVEGTDVPEPIAELTRERTVTAFLDGDHGGELVLKELAQVGDVDYVAFAPTGRSVEDLGRGEVLAALREKRPYDRVEESDTAGEPAFIDRAEIAPDASTVDDVAAGDIATVDAGTAAPPEAGGGTDGSMSVGAGVVDQPVEPAPHDAGPEPAADEETTNDSTEDADEGTAATTTTEETSEAESPEAKTEGADTPRTLGGHVAAIVDAETGRVRLLDDEFEVVTEGDAEEAFALVRDAEPVPTTLVIDGEVSQRLLDVAAQRGVDQIVAASTGEFVKQPTGVRVRTADQLRQPADQ